MTAAPTDAELLKVLAAVQSGDERNDLLDNDGIASACGLPLEHVAACLELAKQRSLIWGARGARKPAPWYTDLELTVQGRRFLSSQTPSA